MPQPCRKKQFRHAHHTERKVSVSVWELRFWNLPPGWNPGSAMGKLLVLSDPWLAHLLNGIVIVTTSQNFLFLHDMYKDMHWGLKEFTDDIHSELLKINFIIVPWKYNYSELYFHVLEVLTCMSTLSISQVRPPGGGLWGRMLIREHPWDQQLRQEQKAVRSGTEVQSNGSLRRPHPLQLV